jgi:PKD domain
MPPTESHVLGPFIGDTTASKAINWLQVSALKKDELRNAYVTLPSTRFLIISLLAVWAWVPVVIGQQPGTVNVRPRVSTAQPGVPFVNVIVDRNRVPLGDEVTFTLAPASVVRNPHFTVTLYFGDGQQQEMRQTEIVHLYRKPGNYTYSVLIKPSLTPPLTPSLPAPTVKLYVNPTTAVTNSIVTFTAQLSRSHPNIKYRFAFADGSQTDWQDAPRTSHSYAAPNIYPAYVDIGEEGGGSVKRVGGSTRQPIMVTAAQTVPVGPIPSPTPKTSPRPSPKPSPRSSPTPVASASPSVQIPSPTPGGSASPNTSPSPTATSSSTPDAGRSPDGGQTNSPSPSSSISSSPTSSIVGPLSWPDGCLMYPLLTLLVVFLAYKAAKYFLVPRPKFVPHVDPGVSRVGAGKPLTIDLQLALDPNLAEGQYGIETAEGSLIKSERGSNG